MKVCIVDYGAGNVQSLDFALNRLGVSGILTSEKEIIMDSDKVIFPGVGEASTAMRKLKSTGLDKVIPNLKQPFLGICLGMQLLCNSSEEGNSKGLNIFSCNVRRFTNKLKVPQMGWNTIENLKGPLYKKIDNSYVYLVHSYYVPIIKSTISVTEYGLKYSSAIQKDNFFGVQFHPEKSSKVGNSILKNFLDL
ncbi:MAG: imidazole glycerol phosphate synthase subunit HisH [Flavobacteriaceae bacterium TMED206]|nr:MAG: imidazole glycerol phosphate synthase subunit HisH [Flavobacteriaceae bacterium TMED206]|tara:strand:- start:311 stop:889 length:579 start_codon:yes stop_codon:yes gene_type:complete